MRRSVPIRWIAFRFLLSRHSDGFVSFVAWVSVLGIALGVLSLTVVNSVINGFQGELRRVITGMQGDVIVWSRAEPISDIQFLDSQIRKLAPQVSEITPSFIAEIMTSGPAAVAGSLLEGIDFQSASRVTDVSRRVMAGRLPEKSGEVAVGSSLAEKIGAQVGTEIRLVFPFGGESVSADPAEQTPGEKTGASREDQIPPPKVINAQVVGLIRMGMNEYDSKYLYGRLEDVQGYLNRPGQATALKMKLTDSNRSRAVSDLLTANFGYPYRAKDWAQLNKNLLYAIEVEKVVIFILLTVIVIVASFNVVSTLMMMIHDKTRDIAILKAMGFAPRNTFALMSSIGIGMGFLGVGIGVSFGLLVGEILERTRWIKIPPDVYYIGFLPVIVNPTELILICGMALMITVIATLYPAYRVARLSPLEGIREDRA